MENLAGNVEAERVARLELERCDIPIVDVETKGEVNSKCRGILKTGPVLKEFGDFTFDRAWYYWMVKGPTPWDVALALYDTPVGKTDIRVAGHCGRPPPEHPWVDHYDDQRRKLWKLKEPEEQAKDEASMDKYSPGWREDNVCVEDPEAVAHRSLVTSYHIDTELGLYVFVAALRKYGVTG